MQLYGSLTSPFVRACRIAAIELGLDDVLELVPTIVRPTEPNVAYGKTINPLRRVPALQSEDEDIIVDSRVIIEYMNERAAGAIIPREPIDRIRSLNRHAICAGATEALVSAVYENRLRPEEKRWTAWADDQVFKAQAALDWCEARVNDFSSFDIGSIALVCLLGYATFRFPQMDWLHDRRNLKAYLESVSSRKSVVDTAPKE